MVFEHIYSMPLTCCHIHQRIPGGKCAWNKGREFISFFLYFWKTSPTFFLFIEFIGVILVNKIIPVSGVQFPDTLSVHCIVHSPPQARSLSITIHLPYTLLHLFPPPRYKIVTVSYSLLTSFCTAKSYIELGSLGKWLQEFLK